MHNNSFFGKKKFRQRSKIQNVLEIIGYYVTKFLNETTLHGLIHVSNASRTIWERIYFLLWFMAVITLAINFTVNVFIRWETTPVIIGIDTHTSTIRNIPFPAITVCNMNQALRSKVENFPRHSRGYAMKQKICIQDVDYSQFDDLKPTSKDDTFTNFIWRVVKLNNGQTCENMIVYCRFGNKEDRCTDFFREVLMDEGICCAFNILHPSYLYKGKYIFVRDFTSAVGTIPIDWNFETGYGEHLPLYYYPRKPVGAGVTMGFTFVLNANLSEYICSSTFSTGLKVNAHNPIDTPHVKETGLSVQPGYQYRFRITTDHFKSLPSIRIIPPERRRCLFNNELELNYFRYYTRRNCEMECDSSYILRRCKCIPYYKPLIYQNASICDVKDFNCEQVAETEMNDKEIMACKRECLPACFDLEYSAKAYWTPLANTSFVFKDGFFANLTKQQMHDNFALVQFYYEHGFFRSKIRSPYTSFTDYLSQTGGILGLMVGFGVMSVPEICYFFLIRPVFDLILNRMPGSMRKMTASRTQSVVDEIVVILAEQKQTFRARVPLATTRRPLKSFNGYTRNSRNMFKGLIRMVPVQKSDVLKISIEEKGLFPYTE